MDIQLDKPNYFPGDFVNATVNIKSKKPIKGDLIQIEVIGKEKAIYQDLTNSEKNKEYKH